MSSRRTALPGAQRGIAVITAMLVVTIATVIAVAIAWQTALDLRRTEGLLAWEQARQFGYGAETLAARALGEVLEEQRASAVPVYSRQDNSNWCGGRQFVLDQGGEGQQQGGMVGGFCDLQGRFNLNNLLFGGRVDEVARKQYRRLLDAVSAVDENVDIEPDVADTIVESTIDWIDPDDTAEYNGAEADAYTSLQPPYRAANFWFTSVSELRAVRGVTPEIYTALAPYVAALPVTNGKRTRINVNTAEVPVLMSLGDDIALANAENWVAISEAKPFEDDTEFREFVDQAVRTDYIDYSTSYFELRGIVSIGTTRLGLYSLLEDTGTAVVPRLRQFDVVDQAPQPAEEEDVDAEELIDPDE